jgi:hypothetical protein
MAQQENKIGPFAEHFVDAPNDWMEPTPSKTTDNDRDQDRNG